jgi:hypothetical protein
MGVTYFSTVLISFGQYMVSSNAFSPIVHMTTLVTTINLHQVIDPASICNNL